jgi:DNA-directed RNA polymerase specialized sigma24 family protein
VNCSKCVHYKGGGGTSNCLECAKYKYLQIKMTPRPQIKMDIVPDSIYENIATDFKHLDIPEAIQKLPIDCGLIIMGCYFLGATEREVSEALNISERTCRYKKKFSLKKIKSLMQF